MSLRTSVVLRAANQNSNDCQWQSYLDLCNTGVAPSRDSLRLQSVSPSLPLRGWCSAQRIRITMIAGGNHAIMYRWLEEPDEVAS